MNIVKFLGSVFLVLIPGLLCSNLLIIARKENYSVSVDPASFFAIGICLLFVYVFFKEKKHIYTLLLKKYVKFVFPVFVIGLLYVLYFFMGFGYQQSESSHNVYIILFNTISSIIIFSYLAYFNIDKKLVVFVFEVILFLIVGSVLVDMFEPQTFSTLNTRAAGFPQNPNAAAFRIASLLGLLLFADISIKKKYLYLVLSAVAIFATFSRSGIILVLLIISIFLYKNVKNFKKQLPRIGIGVGVLILLYSIASSIIKLPTLIDIFDNQIKSQRFDVVTSTNGLVDMQDSRVELAAKYFDKIADNPFWGYGPLAADKYTANAHNMFLSFWFELGLIGLILFILFVLNVFIAARRLNSIPLFILGVCVSVNSIFSHHLMVEYFLLIIAPYVFYYAIKEHSNLLSLQGFNP